MLKQLAGAGLIAGSILVSGCSEGGFQDMIGTSKTSLDERSVRQGQTLTIPPDLQLRPPSNAPRQPVATAQQPYYPPQQPYAAPPAQGQYPPAQGQQAYVPPQQQAYRRPQRQDVYTRNGINKMNPDGTMKPGWKLDKELYEVYKKRKQAKNPNYGTIFNMGNVFKDE